jgi:GNAT superfamily N-acetyltransferase
MLLPFNRVMRNPTLKDELDVKGRVRGSMLLSDPAQIAMNRLGWDQVGQSLELARAVGWAEARADWRILHGAGIVLGAWRDGRLVGQGGLGLCGDAGSIAKMCVAPEARRLGIARRILRALLVEAERRSISVVGLIASRYGRSLYESEQFAAVGEIVIVKGVPRSCSCAPSVVPLCDIAQALECERRWVRSSREAMLRVRLRESTIALMAHSETGEIDGYVLAADQPPYVFVGPLVAKDEDVAGDLVTSVFASVNGPVRVDVPVDRKLFRRHLRSLNLEEHVVRPEMARGASTLPWQVEQRFAVAGQDWG